MNYTKDQITAAINCAELVASGALTDSHPVALTNGTLLTLIYAAKNPQDEGRIKELEDAIADAVGILRGA